MIFNSLSVDHQAEVARDHRRARHAGDGANPFGGFGLFLISSLLWSLVGWLQREISLLVLQGTFTIINMIGIYRWLGT